MVNSSAFCTGVRDGYSFFTAKSVNNDDSYFCFTSPEDLEGDKLFLTRDSCDYPVPKKTDNLYHAVAIRYVRTFNTHESDPDLGRSLEAYRLVGEA